ncbi:hypothetical protein FE257_010970 [Aspergillus nanangensis]|uniref:Uncharacterized protein n=1 Tax=Aspergillus nanangensis TaxID=2582783 RepID=A0AAD4CJP4_ASPNN|nr:hypothetical protein FE257_010970 [Aspergillus nanangensis]
MDPKEDCSRHYELHLHHKANTMSSTSSLIPPPLNYSSSLDRENTSPSPSLNAMCAPGYPGVLSLHHYRRYLSNSPPVDCEEIKKLRRKNAALNLNQNQMQTHTCLPGSPSPIDPNTEQPYYPYAYAYRPTSPKENPSPQKVLDTFRNRLGKYPEQNLDQEDTCLVHPSTTPPPPTTTIVHHGTSFEILNPRESLRFARIVSYIEDVDSYRGPDSTPTPTYQDSIRTSLRTQSIAEEDEGPDSDGTGDGEESKAHHDLVGDSPHQPMPSISERLEENEYDYFASAEYEQRPETARSQESEIGEPGSPIEYHPSYGWEEHQEHPRLGYDFNNAYGWDYGLGNLSGMDGWNIHDHLNTASTNMLQPTEMRIHRRLSRRSIARRQKKTGPLQKLCSALRRKRFFAA